MIRDHVKMKDMLFEGLLAVCILGMLLALGLSRQVQHETVGRRLIARCAQICERDGGIEEVGLALCSCQDGVSMPLEVK